MKNDDPSSQPFEVTIGRDLTVMWKRVMKKSIVIKGHKENAMHECGLVVPRGVLRGAGDRKCVFILPLVGLEGRDSSLVMLPTRTRNAQRRSLLWRWRGRDE
jgi:hypothetical protein